jgi:hypothetical protein
MMGKMEGTLFMNHKSHTPIFAAVTNKEITDNVVVELEG